MSFRGPIYGCLSLTDAERVVLNIALEKYQPDQSEPIYVGGGNALKPNRRCWSSDRGEGSARESAKVLATKTVQTPLRSITLGDRYA